MASARGIWAIRDGCSRTASYIAPRLKRSPGSRLEHLRHHLAPILLANGELPKRDVVLRHHADAIAQRSVFTVNVVPLERTTFASVDLPAPDVPITAVSVPARTENEMLSSSLGRCSIGQMTLLARRSSACARGQL
jgi:hypothetical protein